MLSTEILGECDKFLIAEDGEVVGLACLSIQRSTLERVYLLKRHRRRGHGKQLVVASIQSFLDAQRTPIVCDVTTRGMHDTLKDLPDDLQAVFTLNLSYLSQGDELEYYD